MLNSIIISVCILDLFSKDRSQGIPGSIQCQVLNLKSKSPQLQQHWALEAGVSQLRDFLSLDPPFSDSNSLKRLAPDTFMPPNLLHHRQQLTSEKPCLRHNYATARPASASRKKPMICSSINRFFTSNLLSKGLDSKLRRQSNTGGHRYHLK